MEKEKPYKWQYIVKCFDDESVLASGECETAEQAELMLKFHKEMSEKILKRLKKKEIKAGDILKVYEETCVVLRVYEEDGLCLVIRKNGEVMWLSLIKKPDEVVFVKSCGSWLDAVKDGEFLKND